MKLEQTKISGTEVNVFVPFNELGSTQIDMNKKFNRKLLESKRTIELARSDFRDAGDAMLTDFISDDAMAELSVEVAMALDSYPKANIRRKDDFDDAFWREWETVLVKNGVPYFEDATLADFKVGDRVFVKGVAGSTYGTVVGLPEIPNNDDGDFTEMTVKTDDGQIITADIWETVKEY